MTFLPIKESLFPGQKKHCRHNALQKLSPNTVLISKEELIRLLQDSNNVTAQDVTAKNRHLL